MIRYKVVAEHRDGRHLVWSVGYPTKRSAQQAASKLNKGTDRIRFTVEPWQYRPSKDLRREEWS